MTTAEQILLMAANGERPKALFWLRNIKKRHGIDHYNKLLAEIKERK
jgi:hypothetical protein